MVVTLLPTYCVCSYSCCGGNGAVLGGVGYITIAAYVGASRTD